LLNWTERNDLESETSQRNVSEPSPSRLFISSDNALGADRGDIDDGLALLYILQTQKNVRLLGSIFGNTTASQAARNNQALLNLLSLKIPVSTGASRAGDHCDSYARAFQQAQGAGNARLRLVELGPLSNLSRLLQLQLIYASRVEDVTLVGATLRTFGRWPPLWPFEFNLTHDRPATRMVFQSKLPITILPLDVAKKLRLSRHDLVCHDPHMTEWLARQTERWFKRNLRFYFKTSIIVWDAVLAVYLARPDYFHVEERWVHVSKRGTIRFASAKTRGQDSLVSVRVITSFAEAACKAELLRVIHQTRG
jgi:non-specific riboncleoside hydrolase